VFIHSVNTKHWISDSGRKSEKQIFESKNYINSKIILYSIVTIIMILIIVTCDYHYNNLIMCEICNM